MDYDYTIVMDENYTGPESLEPVDKEAARRDEIDRLHYEYEKMCLKSPNVLDKDEIYPRTYQWRMTDKYDSVREAALNEALSKKIRIADTEAYQKYIEEVKSLRFMPDAWD